MQYDSELSFAKDLAAKAREIALKYYKTNLKFETKEDSSPVTIADKEINYAVIQGVKEHFPEHGVLGEEESWNQKSSKLWVCDPIDGTIAFSMGEPTFMFSIALVEDGHPTVAVAAELANGTVYWATKGGRAFRDGEQIHVSSREMKDAWIAFPADAKRILKYLDFYKSLTDQAYQGNCIHGAVFKGVLIAQGLADGMVYPDTVHPWDFAAVKLLVEEAGGRFTDKDEGDHRVDQELRNSLVVSNGVIHDDLIRITHQNL